MLKSKFMYLFNKLDFIKQKLLKHGRQLQFFFKTRQENEHYFVTENEN